MKILGRASEYDLDLTILPSFVSSFFEKKDDIWVKVYGKKRAAKLKQKEGVIYYENCSCGEALLWSGLWFDPIDYTSRLSRGTKNLITPILEAYRKVRLSVSPFDRELIFIATSLSRTTSYEVNVKRWCFTLFKELRELRDIISMDLTKIGSSYQIKQLKHVVKEYLSKIREDGTNVWDLRKSLLSIKWIGPKVCDAYLLFSRKAPYFTPADVHYRRFVEKLGLISYEKLPEKKFCRRYSCYDCVINNRCITGISIKKFGYLSGWLQTVSYLHEKIYCNKRRCSICALRHLCSTAAE